jgi:hypothetical protein
MVIILQPLTYLQNRNVRHIVMVPQIWLVVIENIAAMPVMRIIQTQTIMTRIIMTQMDKGYPLIRLFLIWRKGIQLPLMLWRLLPVIYVMTPFYRQERLLIFRAFNI